VLPLKPRGRDPPGENPPILWGKDHRDAHGALSRRNSEMGVFKNLPIAKPPRGTAAGLRKAECLWNRISQERMDVPLTPQRCVCCTGQDGRDLHAGESRSRRKTRMRFRGSESATGIVPGRRTRPERAMRPLKVENERKDTPSCPTLKKWSHWARFLLVRKGPADQEMCQTVEFVPRNNRLSVPFHHSLFMSPRESDPRFSVDAESAVRWILHSIETMD
jgi:hypothetical protein